MCCWKRRRRRRRRSVGESAPASALEELTGVSVWASERASGISTTKLPFGNGSGSETIYASFGVPAAGLGVIFLAGSFFLSRFCYSSHLLWKGCRKTFTDKIFVQTMPAIKKRSLQPVNFSKYMNSVAFHFRALPFPFWNSKRLHTRGAAWETMLSLLVQ